jgi:predicted MPP superfamily phosphohydrolase
MLVKRMNVPRGKVTRRRFLAGVGGLAAAGTLLEGIALEPRRISITRHDLGTPSSSDPTPLRLVQLTDLHLRSVGAFEEAVAAQVEALGADAILLTGDAIDRDDALPLLQDFLALLPANVARFSTLGNWEYASRVGLQRLEAIYQRADCQLLVNETASITHEGRRADLVGLDDLLGGRPDLAAAVASESLGPNVLLLSHCPAYRDEVATHEVGATAMLSGHTHGGQIALGRWAPVRPRGSGDYLAGWYRRAEPHLYVSRGLGTTGVPIRFGSVPEIACFDWFLKPG